jgi:allantoin racemase
MSRLLVINPNTSGSVTERLHAYIQAALPLVDVQAITARIGAPYISSETSYAVAGHAVLDAWTDFQSSHSESPDAVLVGCFGDPGLFALRECCAARVTGLAEAGFLEAASHGRFAVVTGGEAWGPILARFARMMDLGDALLGVHTVAPTGAQLANDPAMALELLTEACRDAAERWPCDAIILGGATLAGLAATIQPEIKVPVVDSVLAGARYALNAPYGLGMGAGPATARVGRSVEAVRL